MDQLGAYAPIGGVAVVALVACFALARFTLDLRDGGAWLMSVIVLFLVIFGLTVWPVVAATVPSAPIATSTIAGEGGTVPLPIGYAGPSRIVVAGTPLGTAAAEAHITLTAGTASAEAMLTRQFEGVRADKGRRMTVERDGFVQVAMMSVPAETRYIDVRSSGSAIAGLTVTIHRDWCPLLVLILVDAVVVVVMVLIALRGGDRRIIPAGGALLGFAAAATRYLEPGALVRPMIAALLVGGLSGALLAGFVGSLMTRVLVRPAAPRSL